MSPRLARRRLGIEGGVGALAAALFVLGFGQELWARYMPEYLRVLGASALLVGAYGALQDLLDAAYAYPGGLLSDRLGSRKALLAFAAATAAGLSIYLFFRSTAAVFCGLLLVAAWKSLGLPASFALVAEELSREDRIAGFTAQAVLKRLPIVIAPPLGGLLLERRGIAGGTRLAIAISLVLCLAMLAALRAAFRRWPAAGHTAFPIAPGRSASPPVAAVKLHPVLKRLLVADCLIRLCEGLPDVFLVVWVLEVLRLSPVRFGLLQSVLMGTAILSYLPAALLARRVEKKPFVVLTFFFFALFPVAVVLSRTFWQLAAAYVVGGLREIGEPARKALIVDLAGASAPGRTVGLYYAVRGFVVAGAAAAGGALWTIRPALTFWMAALLGAAGTLWSLRSLPAGTAPEEIRA
ncbi:MAG: MFS transporter [Acidobacteriota bacterium]